jgi:peptide deformylase
VISFSQGFCYLSDGEGCLSVEKKVDGFVPRRMKILIEAIDMNNENKKIKLSAHGFLAIALQHEIDHLNGILYYDHINKEDPFFVDED